MDMLLQFNLDVGDILIVEHGRQFGEVELVEGVLAVSDDILVFKLVELGGGRFTG